MLVTEVRFTAAQHPGALQESEQRYVEIGLVARDALPANAIILAIQHSGSAGFYSGHPTVRFDAIDDGWVKRAGEELVKAGYRPYAIFEDWELPQVRQRLGLEAGAPLPWPLLARMREPVGISVFALAPGERISAPIAVTIAPDRGCVPPAGY
jgi:hypothetical protein